MTGPLVLAALAAVLLVGLAGYATWLRGVAERDALQDRTMLDLVEARAGRPFNRLDAWVRRTPLGRAVRRRIERAGVRARVLDVLAGLAGVALGTWFVASRFVSWWVAVVVAVGVTYAVLGLLDRLEARRREAFVAQLPEVARVLSNATSAGLALRSAIRMAGDDLADPAGAELRRLADELDVGTGLGDALTNLEERLPSRELSVLTRTLIIQSRAGGAVVTALRGMSEALEERKDLRREIRTMLAGSVYTSWIVLLLGVGSLFMTNLIAPGTLQKMTSTVVGQVTLAVAAGAFALGFLMIRRTTRIEV